MLALLVPAWPARAEATVGTEETAGAAASVASPSRNALEALLARAEAGDAESAEELARLYDRGAGFVWDPPSALKWYVAAALGGREQAATRARSLWAAIKPLHRLRTQALLAKYFSDDDLLRIGVGPIERERLRRYPWTSHVRVAGFAEAAPENAMPDNTMPDNTMMAPGPVRPGLPPLPRAKPASEAREPVAGPVRIGAEGRPVAMIKPPRPGGKHWAGIMAKSD